MFKNREVVVTVNKKNESQTLGSTEKEETFEHKTEFVLQKLERIAKVVVVGVCAYVVLDTARQVTVANATFHRDK